MTDNKYDDDTESDDDYKEVIVNSGDYRAEIYEFPVHRDLSVVQCIGQIQSYFNYKIENEYKVNVVGSGTVYKVADNVAFVLTCAHNIRHKIYACGKCNQYYRTKLCSKCKQTLSSSDKKLLKPTHIEFKRRKTTTTDFGLVESEYTCQEIYLPPGYEQNTILQRGFDFAILMFHDDNKYYSKYCKNIQLKIGTKVLRSHKRWCVFGYPGTDSGNVKKNKLYGYGMKSDAQENGFELNECDKPNGNFVNPTKFVLKQRHIDASIGQSGSCVFTAMDKSDVIVFGVHVGGHEKHTEKDYAYNVATLLSEEYINTLNNVTDLYTQNVMIHKLRETLTMKDKEINSLKTTDRNKVSAGDVFKSQRTKLTLLTILLLIVLLLGSNIICYLKYTEKVKELQVKYETKSNEAISLQEAFTNFAVNISSELSGDKVVNKTQIMGNTDKILRNVLLCVNEKKKCEEAKELENDICENTQTSNAKDSHQTMETITSDTKYIIISNDGKTATSHANDGKTRNRNAYGETTIISTTKNIYTWTFICTKRRGSIIIGIISTRNVDWISPWKRIDYGYDGEDGSKYNKGKSNKYGISWNESDTIEMKVDFLKQEIRYKVNGIDQGVAFNNIKIGHNYYLVVSIGTWGSPNVGDSITMNSFTVT